MRVAVIGGNGQLGMDVCRCFHKAGHDVRSFTHADIEITDFDAVNRALTDLAPDFIVNTAAMHHLDKCEADPMSAFAVNVIGPRNLSRFAAVHGACLAHISTDYVFDGGKSTPYVETDIPLPQSVYGVTKLAGEHLVRSIAPRYLILRVSAIYGTEPCRAKGGVNFIERMLALAAAGQPITVVADEFVSPTSTREIAQQLLLLAERNESGLFHATAEGSCSWHEFALAIFEEAGIEAKVEVAPPGYFPSSVTRPKYSVLENAALNEAGLNVFSHWRAGLKYFMSQRAARQFAVAV